MSKFSGVGVALVTPFRHDGELDKEALRNLVDYVIDGGVDYLVALGTTAEAATLSAEEREYVVNIITEQNGGRLPLVIGVGGNNTASVKYDLQTLPYLRQGDAILSVVPYYNKPSQEGMYAHFKVIAENSPLPVILYNVPGRTGVSMNAQTTLRLAHDFENIIAVKEASGNLEQQTFILKDKPDHFVVLSGDDAQTLPLLSIGGEGVISVIANALPKIFSTLVHAGLEGEFRDAAYLHYNIARLNQLLFEEGNPAGIKALLHVLRVIPEYDVRLPLCKASDSLYQKIWEETELV